MYRLYPTKDHLIFEHDRLKPTDEPSSRRCWIVATRHPSCGSESVRGRSNLRTKSSRLLHYSVCGRSEPSGRAAREFRRGGLGGSIPV